MELLLWPPSIDHLLGLVAQWSMEIVVLEYYGHRTVDDGPYKTIVMAI